MWPADVLQILFSLHCLFYYWWERERDWGAPCIIFIPREMWGHMGGASCNRKHCKPKGKYPVRAFGKYQHSVRLLRKHLADRRSCLTLLPPPPPHPPICTVMLSLQTPALSLSMHVWTPLTFCLARALTCRVVAYLLTLLAWIFPFFWLFWVQTCIFSPTGFLLNVDTVKHQLVFYRLQGLFG